MSYYSINRFDGDGSTVVREINFAGGYLDQSHVKAYVEDINGLRTEVPQTDFTFTGPYTLTFDTPTAMGFVLGIYRDTPKGTPLADFSAGARLTEQNLDLVATQAVFVAAEAYDQFVESVGTSTLALTQSALALEQSTAALALANSASLDSSSALIAAQEALTLSSTAEANAALALSAANNAVAASVTATTTANAALALATTADANASSALSIASGIAATANDAYAQANQALLLAQQLELQVDALEAQATETVNSITALIDGLAFVTDKINAAEPYIVETTADFGNLAASAGDFLNEVGPADDEYTMSKGALNIDYGTTP